MASKSQGTFSQEQLLETIGGMTLTELADFVKSLQDKFGVSADMPMAGAAAAPAAGAQAAAAEEKTSFKVTLDTSGPEKIKTIKALRTVTTLGLSEAKTAVEGAPTVIAESASKEDAQKMKKALEEAGAKVTLS
jgi:large subunit ribosomal protein L7/L12